MLLSDIKSTLIYKGLKWYEGINIVLMQITNVFEFDEEIRLDEI